MTASSAIGVRGFAIAAAVALVALASGCATITGSETQNISLQAQDAAGAVPPDAECKLSNDKGSWRAKPPAIAVVNRSAEDLLVHCEAPGQNAGVLRAISRANSGMIGNIIFGGGIGAMIDHSKGTAYDYPSMLRVVFGSSQVVDKQNEQGDAPKNPTVALAPAAPAAAAPTGPAEAGPPAVAPSPGSPALPDAGATYRYAWFERQYAKQQEFTVTVLAVQGWTVSEAFSLQGAKEVTSAVNARDADFLGRRLAEGQSLLEFAPYLPAVGAVGAGAAPALAAQSGYPAGGMEPWTMDARPMEWDQVAVPAGNFRALRLEIRGKRQTLTTQYARTGLAERFEFTAWYVPELKRYVRLRHRQWNGFNGALADEEVELLAFKRN